LNRVGKFEKISFEQFKHDIKDEFGEKWSDEEIRQFYDNIKLPVRATKGSAGYDFFSPIPFSLKDWEDIKIPTGIRVIIDEGWFLACLPRSGQGFKNYLRMANTCGIIDSDYALSSNEGHVWAKVRVEKAGTTLNIERGAAFMQAIFLPFGITYDDAADGVRNGGFGSTDAK
jgi:dUTP pyrophosphatase